jgi:hypothetical protein
MLVAAEKKAPRQYSRGFAMAFIGIWHLGQDRQD